MLQRYRSEIILGTGIVLGTVAFIYLFSVLAPFLLALLMAFASLPVIKFIQKLFKNQELSTVVFLIGVIVVFSLCLLVFASFINRDLNRLTDGLKTLATENKTEIDQITTQAKEYLSELYDFEAINELDKSQIDSLIQDVTAGDESAVDMDAIKDGFASFMSLFSSDSSEKESPPTSGLSFVGIVLASLGYYVLILFNINYFTSLKTRYLGNKLKGRMQQVYEDFNQSFFRYFALRTRIVLILSVLYVTTFTILDMPGLILLMVFVMLLSYIPHLQYVTLIAVAPGCLILAMETDKSFLLYFGIVVGVYVLASLIEEIWLTPKIMEGNMGMNPVVMILALSVGSFLFGLPGLLLGIPLASLLIIYVKRYFLEPWKEVTS